jgi:hypothetical protein
MTKNQVAEELMNKGFDVRVKSNGVIVCLDNRQVSQIEVTMALIDKDEEFEMRTKSNGVLVIL